MKPRKPIAKLGKRGKRYKEERLAAKKGYVENFGGEWKEYESANCQSCNDVTHIGNADFSHKTPAGRRANCNGPEHGIYSCRVCHTWLERGPMSGQARRVLIASPVSMLTGGRVHWPEPLKTSLEEFRKTNGWING